MENPMKIKYKIQLDDNKKWEGVWIHRKISVELEVKIWVR
jgi:hypothetical protein